MLSKTEIMLEIVIKTIEASRETTVERKGKSRPLQ